MQEAMTLNGYPCLKITVDQLCLKLRFFFFFAFYRWQHICLKGTTLVKTPSYHWDAVMLVPIGLTGFDFHVKGSLLLASYDDMTD